MPKMGDAMESGTLTTWRKKNGEKVNTGDIIAEIETDKSNVELEAESAGVLVTMVDPGAEVPVGTVIATIGEGSLDASSLRRCRRKRRQGARVANQFGRGT